MAKIIENKKGRRLISLTTDDVISIVREYQNAVLGIKKYSEIREELDKRDFYLPEEI
ncbi:hypothetical protein IKQ26_06050 [bacterium]|nr:hypothetical protein [bacterium]